MLSLHIGDSVSDSTPFGHVRQRANMPRDMLQTAAWRMRVKPASKLALHWQALDGLAPTRTARGVWRWLGPRACTPSSAYRNDRSPKVLRLRWRNACCRTY